jgi:hypothetical protein
MKYRKEKSSEMVVLHPLLEVGLFYKHFFHIIALLNLSPKHGRRSSVFKHRAQHAISLDMELIRRDITSSLANRANRLGSSS